MLEKGLGCLESESDASGSYYRIYLEQAVVKHVAYGDGLLFFVEY